MERVACQVQHVDSEECPSTLTMVWSGRNDFYVTVPSSDSVLEFANNTPSHFKVRLNTPLVFYQSGWSVGLAHITMPPLMDAVDASLGVVPNYHAYHQGATDDHGDQTVLMKVSWFLNEPQQQGGTALERYWTSIQGDTMDMSNIHDGVSLMKRFVDYVEWKRTQHVSRLFIPRGTDYSAGSEFFINSTRRHTYLKWVWENVAGQEELLVDKSKLHIQFHDKTPQLHFSEAFAKAMRWLSPDGRELGPNLRIEYLDDSHPLDNDTSREDLFRNRTYDPNSRQYHGGEACLWVVQNGMLMLSQAVNWRFVHLNDSFNHMHPQHQRTLHVYSDAALSRMVGNRMENLLSVINFEGQGKGSVFFEPQQIHYHPIKNDYMEMLEFDIRDTHGVPVRFEKGHTVITLHFKRE